MVRVAARFVLLDLLEAGIVWKWLIGLMLVLLLGCVGSGYWAYSSGKLKPLMEKFNPESKLTAVRLEPVTKGVLIKTISAPGLIEPRTKVEISAQVSARIIAIPFRENTLVKKGDVVVRLDAVDLAALLDSAKAQVKSEEARLEGARAQHTNASRELARRRELFATKDISKAELDQAELEYARAESNLRSAEFAIDIAKANVTRAEKDLSNTVISAPFDGVVTKRNAEVGELVVVGTLNNPGSVIMEIADLSDMIVKAKVDEANIAPVKAGQKAKVFLNPFPEKSFEATVERVSLVRQLDTKDGTAYFETELKLENPNNFELREGFTANSDIGVEVFRDVLLVPSQAIVDRPVDDLPKEIRANQYVDPTKKFARVVYVFDGDKAITKPVSIGASDLTKTVILGGLAEGERTIAGPFKVLLTLKEGQKLQDEATVPEKDVAGKRVIAGAEKKQKGTEAGESKDASKPEPKSDAPPEKAAEKPAENKNGKG